MTFQVFQKQKVSDLFKHYFFFFFISNTLLIKLLFIWVNKVLYIKQTIFLYDEM